MKAETTQLRNSRQGGIHLVAEISMAKTTILLAGSYVTGRDELGFLADRIAAQGGDSISMDIGLPVTDHGTVQVASGEVMRAGGGEFAETATVDEESSAMRIMAAGAAKIALDLCADGVTHGVIFLCSNRDLEIALDVCAALPLGFPKHVVSTISFSPLIPPHCLAADIQMTLWHGGLLGLNSISRSSLSQVAGAVMGAVRAVQPPSGERPVVGMTSFGSSSLTYMTRLKPALESRGFELAVFHATGMGGMAFERIASSGLLACAMDFAVQEITNYLAGSLVHAGPERLEGAGRAGIPQIIAPGCIDSIDSPAWDSMPHLPGDRKVRMHNRLLFTVEANEQERRNSVREICKKLGKATGQVKVVIPLHGVRESDRNSAIAYSEGRPSPLVEEFRRWLPKSASIVEVAGHINDAAFTDEVLEIFDAWLADGTIRRDRIPASAPLIA